jgi:hypothetical protein
MTKEEAISIISGYEAYGCGYCLQGGEEVEEALRLAVDALRQETVIRCRDCKHRMHDKTCIKVMKRKPDDGFCDEGERNEW